MPFGRRRAAHRSRDSNARDPFDHLADERRAAESDVWFLQPDDAPDLEVQAGMSSNITAADLANRLAADSGADADTRPEPGTGEADAGDTPPDTPSEADPG
jgi:hypothetical protein